MFRRVLFIVILSLLITSCGGSAAPTAAPATQPPAATQSEGFPVIIATATPVEPTQTATASPSQTPAPSPTPAITQTPTDLPTLEIPTEVTNAPATLVWDGVPTYLGDSTPGYDFRVTYTSDLWAVTQDQFGFPSLVHRNIPNCVISVTSGRGMPANVTTEHDVLYTDTVTFDVSTAFENGVKKFVTYTGGDKNRLIVTGFEVSFDEQADQCIADAVTVLSTLRAVPVSEATPQP
jgi:hypothetical protein